MRGIRSSVRAQRVRRQSQVSLYFTPLSEYVSIQLYRPDHFRIPPSIKDSPEVRLPIVKQLRLTKLRSGNPGNYTHLVREYFVERPRIVQVGEVLAIKRQVKQFSHRLSLYSYNQSIYDFYRVDQLVYQDYNQARRDANQEEKSLNNRKEMASTQIKITDYGVIKDVSSQLQDIYYLWPSYMIWPQASSQFQIIFQNDTESSYLPRLGVSDQLLHPFLEVLPQSLGQVYDELSQNLNQFMFDQSNIFSLLNCRLRFPLNDAASVDIIMERLRCESGLALHSFDLFEYFSLSKLQGVFESLCDLSPAIVHISSLQALFCLAKGSAVDQSQKDQKMQEFVQTELRKLEARLQKKRTKLCLLYSFEVDSKVPSFCKVTMPFTYTIKPPDDKERVKFIDFQIQRRRTKDVRFSNLLADHGTLETEQISRSLSNRTSTQIYVILNRALTDIINETEDQESHKESLSERVEAKVEKIQKQHKVTSQASAKVPSVKWEDVGGLQDAKEDILDTIQLPLAHPELFASGIAPRSGLLFFGPPGTGKTLLAKAIATECSLNFISVKGPELLNMYIGESEKNIREVFERGRANRPCILFFDELDSLAPARGRSSDSNQVMDRIVAQLLTEMSGVTKAKGLFVIGATNRPDLLDSALLQPGRFDKPIYLGMPSTSEQRIKILKAQTRKYILDSHISFEEIVEGLPPNFTGADFQALTSEAFMSAVKKKIARFESEIKQFQIKYNLKSVSFESYVESVCKTEAEKQAMTRVVLETQDFDSAKKMVQPSVKMSELRHYEELRAKFSAS